MTHKHTKHLFQSHKGRNICNQFTPTHPAIESNNDCKTQQQFSFIVLFSLLGITFSYYSDGRQRLALTVKTDVWFSGHGKRKKTLPSSLHPLYTLVLDYAPCLLYIRCYNEVPHTGVIGMSALDSGQYQLTPQRPLFRPSRVWSESMVNQGLLNKDLWCGDVTSWQAVTLFDVGSLLVDEGARRYPTGMDVGWERAERKRSVVNEHRSRRMLWSVTVRLLALTKLISFSGFCGAEVGSLRSSWPEC